MHRVELFYTSLSFLAFLYENDFHIKYNIMNVNMLFNITKYWHDSCLLFNCNITYFTQGADHHEIE